MLDQEQVKTATKYYLEGDYQAAASLFDELSVTNPDNPYLLINSANSHNQLKNHGLALSKYYKAKAIIPRNKELNQNLVLAQNDLKLKQPSMMFYNYMTFPEALLILLAFNLLFIFRHKIYPNSAAKFALTVLFVLALANASFIGLGQKIKTHATINTISTTAYSGDNEAFSELFELLDGQIVELVREEDEWSQLKYDGQLGWVKNEDLELI